MFLALFCCYHHSNKKKLNVRSNKSQWHIPQVEHSFLPRALHSEAEVLQALCSVKEVIKSLSLVTGKARGGGG